jgi:hypothetical protein
MPCSSCLSNNQAEFPAEINLHFPGSDNLTKPSVWLFPKVLVCLNCGASHFAIAERELVRLTETQEFSIREVKVRKAAI